MNNPGNHTAQLCDHCGRSELLEKEAGGCTCLARLLMPMGLTPEEEKEFLRRNAGVRFVPSPPPSRATGDGKERLDDLIEQLQYEIVTVDQYDRATELITAYVTTAVQAETERCAEIAIHFRDVGAEGDDERWVSNRIAELIRSTPPSTPQTEQP